MKNTVIEFITMLSFIVFCAMLMCAFIGCNGLWLVIGVSASALIALFGCIALDKPEKPRMTLSDWDKLKRYREEEKK